MLNRHTPPSTACSTRPPLQPEGPPPFRRHSPVIPHRRGLPPLPLAAPPLAAFLAAGPLAFLVSGSFRLGADDCVVPVT
jgi:hypothetical protein